MKKLCGIYCIENIVTFKKYIGSSVNITHRFSNHKSSLRHNKHKNEYLQSAWDKYGEDKFIFKIIEIVPVISLESKEGYWIEFYKSYDNNYGYNLIRNPERKSLNLVARKKRRERMLGNKLAKGINFRPEIKEMRRLQKLGTKQSEETKEKIRQANLGHLVSLDTRNKISLKHKLRMSDPNFVHPNKGKHMSDEQKQKISKTNKGKKRSKEEKEQRSKKMLGNTRRHDWWVKRQIN